MMLIAEADIDLHFSGHAQHHGALEWGGSGCDQGTAFSQRKSGQSALCGHEDDPGWLKPELSFRRGPGIYP